MEKYIAAALTLVLLIAFVPQNVVQQNNHILITRAEAAVEAAKEKAAQEGRFTDGIIAELEDSLAVAGVQRSGIVYGNMTRTVKYRTDTYDEREMIEYEVGIPIRKIIVNNEFYGISDEDNAYVYWFRGKIASERVSH